jgi:hypothetical protein
VESGTTGETQCNIYSDQSQCNIYSDQYVRSESDDEKTDIREVNRTLKPQKEWVRRSRAKVDSIQKIIKVFAAYNIVIGVDEIKARTYRETEKMNTTKITFQQGWQVVRDRDVYKLSRKDRRTFRTVP